MFQCDGVRPDTNSQIFEEIRLMVVCLLVWHIWTKHCKCVIQRQKLPCGEVMLNIWFKLVGSLVARNVRTRRSRNGKVKVYMLKWGGFVMMLKSLTRPKWNYQAPRWLFSITAPNVVHRM